MPDQFKQVRQITGPRSYSLASSKVLIESAQKVLAESSAAPVRVRLLRDVLQRPADDRNLVAAINDLEASPHVQVLAQEQRADGGWGQFHTKDYHSKQKTATTEAGIGRAVELGLPRNHIVFQKAQRYLKGILKGSIRFPDRDVRGRPPAIATIAGATLSRFAPESPLLDAAWEFWFGVAKRALATGRYDPQAELRTTGEVLRRGRHQWLRLDNMYAVMILGSRADCLPPDLESAYVRWLCEDRPKAMMYLDIRLNQAPQQLGHLLGAWLRLLELLSAFPSAGRVAKPLLERLLAARSADGLWDFGMPPSSFRRLSDNYRRKAAIAHDWTTRVACLLSKYLA